MVKKEKCKQMIGRRPCSHLAKDGDFCHQHGDRSLMAHVARDCGVSKALVENIVDHLLDRMSWAEINAYHQELRRGQGIYEDAGGYMLRCIGRLFGKASDPSVTTYRQAAKAMLGNNKKIEGGRQ